MRCNNVLCKQPATYKHTRTKGNFVLYFCEQHRCTACKVIKHG